MQITAASTKSQCQTGPNLHLVERLGRFAAQAGFALPFNRVSLIGAPGSIGNADQSPSQSGAIPAVSRSFAMLVGVIEYRIPNPTRAGSTAIFDWDTRCQQIAAGPRLRIHASDPSKGRVSTAKV